MSSKGNKAARVMGGNTKSEKKSGKKKPVHKMAIRRASNGGFIVDHSFKSDPNDPMGTPESEEHQIGDVDQLQAHVAQHMGDQPEAEQQEPAEPAAPAPVQVQ